MSMQVQNRYRKQQATYWPTSPDGFGGDTFSTPVLIMVRWEDRREKYVSQLDRQEVVSKAVVFVDRDMKIGDYLCLGNYVSNPDPSSLSGAYKIQKFDLVTDLRTVSTMNRAVL